MKKHIAFLLIICFAISLNSMAQNRIRVNNTPGVDADYSDLQVAIDAASAGDVIYIEGTGIPHSGTYHVNKAYLTLIGPGYFLALNDSTQANTAPAIIENLYLDESATGAMVMGLKVSSYLYINASSANVSRNHLYRVTLAQINSVANVSLSQNYITEYIGSGGYNLSAEICNNIITASSSCINTGDKASLDIYNNVMTSFYNTSTGYYIHVRNSSLKNNIIFETAANNDPLVIDPNPSHNNSVAYNILCADEIPEFPNNVWDVAIEDVVLYNEGGPEGKYVLINGSPAIGAGENGVDCGIFGGNTPYVFSGLPPIPHIFESNIPFSGSSSDGLPVHIKAKTQD